MGKALLEPSEDKATTPSPDIQTKKSVSFAPEITPSKPEVDWGDLAQGKLRSSNTSKPVLLHSSRAEDTLPMKRNVVERTPSSKPVAPQPEPDSDDESEPDSPLEEDDDEDELAGELEPEDIDIDEAQHQREIAREYYKQRATVGQSALEAMRSPTHVESSPVST